MIKKLGYLLFILFLYSPVNGQIRVGYEPVQSPTVQHQHYKPNFSLPQTEIERRQALFYMNYKSIEELKDIIRVLSKKRNEEQFLMEMNIAFKKLDYLLDSDLSLMADEIYKVAQSMQGSVLRYNIRLQKRNNINELKKRAKNIRKATHESQLDEEMSTILLRLDYLLESDLSITIDEIHKIAQSIQESVLRYEERIKKRNDELKKRIRNIFISKR